MGYMFARCDVGFIIQVSISNVSSFIYDLRWVLEICDKFVGFLVDVYGLVCIVHIVW